MPSNNQFQLIADNPLLLTALEELLRSKFALEKLNDADTDEVLGQKVRARLIGLKAVDEVIREIAAHKTVQEGTARRQVPR